MKYTVGQIAEVDAMALNDGLDDDNKTAFQTEDRTEFYIKDPNVYHTTLPSSKYVITEITQDVVDGTSPAVKKRNIYP